MVALEDKLSSLPDEILVEILSRLPIKYSASTSVLSRRWQFLWTQIDQVVLTQYCFPRPLRPDMMYKTFNHISQQLGFYKIDMFCLYAPYPLNDSLDECFSVLNSLIHQISQRHVQKLYIALNIGGHKLVRISLCALSTRHLVMLSLVGMIEIDDVASLPNLEELYLSVHSLPCQLLNNFIKSCPKLKKLSVFGEITDGESIINSFCLSSPKLEYLNVGGSPVDGEFVIDTPNLEHVELQIVYPGKYRFLRKPSALIRAEIVCWGFFLYGDVVLIETIIELFRMISNVRHLSIDDDVIKAFKLLPRDEGFPFFKSVTTLVIRLTNREGHWNDVLFSLQCFRNLEYLEVISHFGRPDFKLVIEPHSKQNVDHEPLTRLKTITFDVRKWTSDDVAVINYVLSNIETLELLILDFWRYFLDEISEERLQECQEFRHQVLLLSKPSSKCEIRFRGLPLSSSSNGFEKRSVDC